MQKPIRGFQGRANVPEFEENFEKIDAFRTHKYRQFSVVEIDLSKADVTDKEYSIEANGIFIEFPLEAEIRVNELDSPKLSLNSLRYIGGYVHRIFVTAKNQSPKLKLLCGVDSEVGYLSNSNITEEEVTGTAPTVSTKKLAWWCQAYSTKVIRIKNTGDTNDLAYSVFGYIGDDYETISTSAGIAPGEAETIRISESWKIIQVFLNYVSAATTYKIEYIGTTQFSLPDFTAKEDTAHVSGDYGVPSLAVRKNANGALSADGDYSPIQVNTTGYIKVYDDQLYYLSRVEDSVHYSADKGVMSLAVRNDAATNLVSADGDYAPLEVDANGRLHVINSGAEVGALIAGEKSFDIADGETGFVSQAVTKKVSVMINDMGDATWIKIGTTGTPTVGWKLTAAGQGIEDLPVSNVNLILMDTDATAGNDVTVAYIGV